MKFSIIIPAYNASQCITACLDSIYRLPFATEQFEVLVVDDCSTDNTCAVVEQYCQSDSRHSNIVLLRQASNNRQGAARNRALAQAKGRFIVFLDADDQLLPGIARALDMAENESLDMVMLYARSLYADGSTEESPRVPYTEDDLFSGIELQTSHPYLHSVIWTFIWNKALMDRVGYPFSEGVLYEDTDYLFAHLYYAKTIRLCCEPAYLWVCHDQSTTHITSYKNLSDHFLLGVRMLGLYNQIPDKSTPYADSILEGGSYNIWISCMRLSRLSSVGNVRRCFDRIDRSVNRADFLCYNMPRYCWTPWTRLCLGHRHLATMLLSPVLLLVSLIRKIK